jgi:ribose/xylose/arabinose/galactoside ABC-type transport system permease subunit
LILAGWLIGAAIVSTVNVTLGSIRLSDLAYYMFLIGTIIGAYVIFQSLRRQRREDDNDY